MPRPDRLAFDAYQTELSADELALENDATCHAHRYFPAMEIPTDIEDETLDDVCGKIQHAQYNACRRHCLVSGRARVGATLHYQVVDALLQVPAALAARTECKRAPDKTFWSCLGLMPLPSRLSVKVERRPNGDIGLVTVRGRFIPSGDELMLVLYETHAGCAGKAWGVDTKPPR